MTFLDRILDVPVTDPDNARRRKLLNILLLGVVCVALSVLIIVALIGFQSEDMRILMIGSLATLLGAGCIYLVNRMRNSGPIASHLFLILLTVVMAFSDSPEQVATGRALFAFTIPIIIASMLVDARASFLYALLSDLIITILAFRIGIEPNFPAILGFMLIALVSWLSARSLEQVLKELRLINQELDQRVARQTIDLTNALTREREELGRIHAILEGIADGVLVFDEQDRVIIANAALGRYFGMPPEALVGQKYSDLIQSLSLLVENEQELIHLLANPDEYQSNIRIPLRDYTFSVNASNVIAANGDFIGKVAVVRDFTREAEVENLKSMFLATVSHELRTPLNAILGYSEMLKEQAFGALTEKQTDISARIMNSTRRLLRIVNDLLDQAQIEAGRMRLNQRNFSVTDMLDGVMAVVDPLATQKKLTVACQVEPQFPRELFGDPDRLQQILVNLVMNAIKFTDAGGVAISLFSPRENYWGFRVKDTGKGIAPEQQKQIFEPFRQVEDVATRSHGGIGLGLSIVQNLVSLMNGEIEVFSLPEQGTTFTVIFPIQQ
jgi:PAS domain S-box-containing protein